MQVALAEKTARLKEEKGLVPGLVVILVGENPASQVYVRNKERSALALDSRVRLFVFQIRLLSQTCWI